MGYYVLNITIVEEDFTIQRKTTLWDTHKGFQEHLKSFTCTF